MCSYFAEKTNQIAACELYTLDQKVLISQLVGFITRLLSAFIGRWPANKNPLPDCIGKKLTLSDNIVEYI